MYSLFPLKVKNKRIPPSVRFYRHSRNSSQWLMPLNVYIWVPWYKISLNRVCVSTSEGRLHWILNSEVLVARLCLSLCDSMDCSLPSSFVHRILQARILEWVAIPFSKRSSQPRDQNHILCTSYNAGGFFTAEPLGKPVKSMGSQRTGHHWATNIIV